jgi:hypothetical protein
VLLVLLPECQAWYFWFQKFIMAISIKTWWKLSYMLKDKLKKV